MQKHSIITRTLIVGTGPLVRDLVFDTQIQTDNADTITENVDATVDHLLQLPGVTSVVVKTETAYKLEPELQEGLKCPQTHSHSDCRSCGTSDEDCRDRVFRDRGACCRSCGRTDTHNEAR